jgi:uncharacterized membrane protein (DUF373 family)
MSNAGDTETSTKLRSFRTLLGRCSGPICNVIRETREAWPGLSSYKRFEQLVSLALTAVVGLVVVAALFELCLRVVSLLLNGLIDPADQEVFQALFGMILTVLIALEFNHSIMEVLERENSIVQVRTVVLIALLALVRKFIVLDTSKTDPFTIIGLAAAVLALGAAHWMVRDRDRKDPQEKTTPRTL